MAEDPAAVAGQKLHNAVFNGRQADRLVPQLNQTAVKVDQQIFVTVTAVGLSASINLRLRRMAARI